MCKNANPDITFALLKATEGFMKKRRILQLPQSTYEIYKFILFVHMRV